MLTIFGKPSRKGGFCDGVTRRDFLTIGGTLLGGAVAAAAAARPRRSPASGSSHKAIINVYPARRSAAPGHVGPQAGRPARDPRRVQADRHQRARHRDLRALPAHRRDDGQVRRHPLAGRLRRRPRRLPVHDRPQARTPQQAGYWPVDGRLGVEGCRGRSTRPSRRTCR